MNTLLKVVGLLALVAVCLAEDKIDCSTKFTKPTEDKDHTDTILKCRKELGLGDSEKDVTDEKAKCLTKCVLEDLKLMADGKLDKKAILADAESMILDKKDEEFKAKIDGITNHCFDEAEKQTKLDACGLASFFGNCVGEEQSKLCLPPPPPPKQ